MYVMNDIKKTKQYKEIEKVYIPDIAVIIATYILNKKPVFERSWRHQIPRLYCYISLIDDKILAKDVMYDMNGNEEAFSKFVMPTNSRCVADENRIYIADYENHCLTIIDRSTGSKLLENKTYGRPWEIALMNSSIYIVFKDEGSIVKYDTDGNVKSRLFVSHQRPTRITVHDGSLYVLCDGNKIIQYSEQGVVGKVISTSEIMYSFIIHENYIYGFDHNLDLIIYDVNDTSKRLRTSEYGFYEEVMDINVCGNNIIVLTRNNFRIYSMMYAVENIN